VRSGRWPLDREADGEALRWLARCRRHLRRHVGIGLYSLVCRPARVAITATHVDVRQGLDAADLRIRRAGLDVDPGWVPWLGRVLALSLRAGSRMNRPEHSRDGETRAAATQQPRLGRSGLGVAGD
jgi:hypothetical protein